MVPGGNGLRSALVNALAQNRASQGAIPQLSQRLGGGIPASVRLQALAGRIHPGLGRQPVHQPGPANPMHADAHAPRHPETPPASMVDPMGAHEAGAPAPRMGGHAPGDIPPDIQPIIDLIGSVDPAHFPAILQRLSAMVAQGGGAPQAPAAPIHGGPVQY